MPKGCWETHMKYECNVLSVALSIVSTQSIVGTFILREESDRCWLLGPKKTI